MYIFYNVIDIAKKKYPLSFEEFYSIVVLVLLSLRIIDIMQMQILWNPLCAFVIRKILQNRMKF